MNVNHPVLAVTGLAAEARIASGTGVTTLSAGGDPARLALLLQAALANGAKAVISFGIAGGLQPGLKPGTTIIGRVIDGGDFRTKADSAWIDRLSSALPHALVMDLAGVDAAVCGTGSKRRLHHATGAAAVDMESHIAARLAAQHGVPFAALRTIADPAERTVPSCAAVGMKPDGSANVAGVLRKLGRNPAELPGLIRTAFDARAALVALVRNRERLCSLFGFNVPRLDPARDGLFGRPSGIELEVGNFAPLVRASSVEIGTEVPWQRHVPAVNNRPR